MTAQGITRERDRWSAAGRSTIGIDATPLTGTWKILHPKATGIVGLDATLHDGRLLLWIIETDESGTQETGTLLATPLSSAVDSDQAMGLLASGELGPPASSRTVRLCGYLNRGLLLLKVHVLHHADATRANVMYRAHFYRPDGVERP
ncbi:MAG TPA: hypothetical protein VF734_19375 [Pseudonocardiaceae bacterium]